jgi:hypothetical protein
MAASSSCEASSSMRHSMSSYASQPRGLLRVAGGHVGAGEDVEPLELIAGIPHVAPHRRVGPGALGVPEEAQVLLDELRDRRDRVAVEAQRLQALARQARTLDVVVVEADTAARLELARRGLADVVQQRGQAQRRIGRRPGCRACSSSMAWRRTVSECS